MSTGKDAPAELTTRATADPPAKAASSNLVSVRTPKSRKEPASAEGIELPGTRKATKSDEAVSTTDGENPRRSAEKFDPVAKRGSREAGKRHPGKINLEATKAASDAKIRPLDTSHTTTQTPEDVPASTTTTSAVSQPETPVTAVSQASGANVGKQGQARTNRVLPTSKPETPQKAAKTGASKDPITGASANFPSRRGSLSSIQFPGTPASERISDNVSMTSTSMSRANSPPPSKVGTAPVRQLTKNQQKKDRQAKAKQAEQAARVDELPTKPVVEEPVQAPIIGRKKKQKKTASRETGDSTPAVTRPTSPQPHEEETPENEASAPPTRVNGGKKEEVKAAPESEAETPISPARQSTTEQPQKNTLNAAALFAALQRSGEVAALAADIFKPVISLNHRFDIDPQSLDRPEVSLSTLTDEQNQQLDAGEPLCIDQGNNKHVLILPDRRILRDLSPEQAKRYIELRKQAVATSDSLYHAGHGPAPPKQPRLPASSTSTSFLLNPFLSESDQSPSAFSTNTSHLPQAFGSVESGNPTVYLDEAAANFTTRSAGGIGVEDAEQAWIMSRRETEGLEKRLNKLLVRNRRMVFGGAS